MSGGDFRRLAAGAALVLGAASVAVQQSQGMPLLTVAGAVPLALCVVGAGLGALVACVSWPRRVGGSLHCGRCGYRHDQRGRLIVVCPECGSPWRWIGWSKAGRPIGSAARTAAGASLWVLACFGAVLGEAASQAALRVMPEPVLIREIAHMPDGALCGQAAELTRRGVSAGAAPDLAAALEQKRARQGRLSPESRELLEKARSTAGLDPG